MHQTLFFSPRNTDEQNQVLLKRTECHVIFCSAELLTKLSSLQKGVPQLRLAALSALDDWLVSVTPQLDLSSITYEKAKWDPAVVLHSSGSTGPPKPITLPHGYFSIIDRELPPIRGRGTPGHRVYDFGPDGGRYLSPFPPYHLAGIMSLCVYPCFAEYATVILPLPNVPPSGQQVYQILGDMTPRLLYAPPSIIESVAKLPEGMQRLRKLDYITYTGGFLAPWCGDELSGPVKISQFYGSTEAGAAPLVEPKPEDWGYLEIHPAYQPTMEPSVDGASELVLKHTGIPEVDESRGNYWTFPQESEWRTKDLFLPHPTKPNLWNFHARQDDILVLSNGEKYNPIPAETEISKHPKVLGAVVYGAGRPRPVLVLEAKNLEDATSGDVLVDELWPIIEKSNSKVQEFGRVSRSMILVVPPGDCVRAPKGTIIRNSTFKKLQTLIELKYEGHGANSVSSIKLEPWSSRDDIHTSIRKCVDRNGKLSGISEKADLFSFGIDSLETTDLATQLRSEVRFKTDLNTVDWLSADFIFRHPTIDSLTASLYSHCFSEGASEERGPRQMIKPMIESFTQDLPERSSQSEVPSPKPISIVLTGSTGSLGIRLLKSLLLKQNVGRIFCLDRSASAQDRVLSEPIMMDVKNQGLTSKLEFYTITMGQEGLGLPQDALKAILKSVDIFVHNAWKKNFRQSLQSFEPDFIKSIRTFIDWSIASARNARIVFMSSTAATANWSNVHSISCPEDTVEDENVTLLSGYAQSKFVSERILGIAASRSAVPSTVLRIGQFAGPVDSNAGPLWSTDEWFPSLILTSQNLNAFPDWLPPVYWIPVDRLSLIVEDLVFADADSITSNVYNVVNPREVPWSAVSGAFEKNSSFASCKRVPLTEWVATLKSLDSTNAEILKKYPAVKLLDFFDGLLLSKSKGFLGQRLDTSKAVANSKHLQNLEPVNEVWMQTWLSQWGF